MRAFIVHTTQYQSADTRNMFRYDPDACKCVYKSSYFVVDRVCLNWHTARAPLDIVMSQASSRKKKTMQTIGKE